MTQSDSRRAVASRIVVLLLACTLTLTMLCPAQSLLAGQAGDQATVTTQTTEAEVAKPLIPRNISTYGGDIDSLFMLILWITGITLVIVQALLIYFIFKYRHREGRTKAYYTHGSGRIEVTWSVATAAILIFLAVVQQSTWVRAKMYRPDPGKEEVYLVRVFGEQFEWWFVYPGPDGKFEPQDDYERLEGFNDLGLANNGGDDKVEKKLIVPVDTKVLLEINSIGKFDLNTEEYTLPVLHSFFSPNLRLKQDLVPFNPAPIWFEATETGKFEIVCAELCGYNHYTMRADFEVLSDAEVNQQLRYDWKANRPSGFPVKPQTTSEE